MEHFFLNKISLTRY